MSDFDFIDGYLFKKGYDHAQECIRLQAVVPRGGKESFEVPGEGLKVLGARESLLLEFHNNTLMGHLGREATIENISRTYWWPSMHADVSRWIKSCLICRRNRSTCPISTYSRSELPHRPLRVIQIDTVGLIEPAGDLTGAKAILSVVCCFSRWPWLIALKDKSEDEVARGLLVSVFSDVCGFPTVIRSDNGSEFMGRVLQRINKFLGIHHVGGTTYHPQSQGASSIHTRRRGSLACRL